MSRWISFPIGKMYGGMAARISHFCESNEKIIAGVVGIILFGSLVFRRTLSFVPADGDDLVLLSAISHSNNPLVFLTGDWGGGNGAYRPLHSISLWVIYQFVGVSNGYNQLINVFLHLVVVTLLFLLIIKVQTDWVLAFLASSLSLFSIFTYSAASWVSDRPSLVVAISVLLFLHHLLSRNYKVSDTNLGFVAILIVLALLSKESGLVLPLLFLVLLVIETKSSWKNFHQISWRYYLVPITIILIYLGLHELAFLSVPHPYDEDGYLFGSIRYSALSQLPLNLQLVARLEHIVENTFAPFVAIIGPAGQIPAKDVWERMHIWLPMLLLIMFSIHRPLSKLQMISLLIIGLNGIIHFDIFRPRALYTSQIAITLFIGSFQFTRFETNRLLIMKILATWLLIANSFWVAQRIDVAWQSRFDELNTKNLATIISASPGRIDADIIKQVLERYRK